MDENGQIYASKTHTPGKFHHSSLGSGKPVAGAGEINVKDGVLTEISNGSGHYQPTQELNSQVLHELETRGVNIDNVKITDF